MTDEPVEPKEEPQEEPKEESEEKDSSNMFEKANKMAARLEVANAKQEELIKRQEKLAAQRMLAGRAEAGQPVQKISKEEQESNERIKAYGLAVGAQWAKKMK